MNLLGLIWLAIRHPQELKALVNYKLWYDPPNLEEHPEITRINEPNMKACWLFLDQTSRSFSAVIKELDGELSRVVCIFYLVLRGLDTVEDDMSIPIELKETLLKSFYQKLDQPGWNFDGCSPTEKDRNLLVEFDKVISEFQVLEPKYRTIITDVTARMGSGMARFARTAVDGGGIFSIDTMAGFDGYCHYVAGLVGEGLSRLFSESGKENEELGYQLRLSNSMGLLLQKTNILRDFREDVDAGRMFWPEAIWRKFVDEPRLLTLPQFQKQARWALTEMTIDALSHAVDALEYMTLLKNQSIFNFCAIPQVMAIATLELCFENLDVFQKNVKIRRSLMALLISKAINPRDLSYIFVDFAHRIHQRADPSDPNYLKLCVLVGKIIAWAENRYPSFITPTNPPPLYSDDPIASNIQDVRVHQQPALRRIGLQPPVAPRAAKAKMGIDDLKFILIIVSSVLALILSVSAILGSLVYLATKYHNSVDYERQLCSLRHRQPG
ncbi:bifunctional farnesyl-diphosphate farnesyltransferase/squalene synthase [Puccinia graminis f. sp. tritici]|uniref:Squalene synthase n=1 Tax=Puccinia graminis f. sp. tritici TaxID=56615 RepID=A0A5B0RPE2_PUCGR|nr:bifunctional farnesyl-diphosphate farnesyltransferase/squalene synthase [Puccinia graminis f. sp. tritici]